MNTNKHNERGRERNKDRLYPAKAPRRKEKMKDNEIGEIEGNTALKRVS